MIEDFYPTPPPLIERLLAGIDLEGIEEILDLGAGRGDIAEYIVNAIERRYYHRRRSVRIDVVELNPDLQHILRGKGFRLVHDDILTFETHKVYDLIIANFPFSIGAECLQVALDLLARSGGHLRCLVNAETLKNPFTRLRQTVKHRLEELGAEIEYLPGEFVAGDRPTQVEAALIKLHVERPDAPSIILENLQKAPEVQAEAARAAELVERNFMAALVARFNLECRLGVRMIEEYFTLKPHISDRIKRESEEHDDAKDLIELKVEGAYQTKASYINCYLSGVRHKYWSLLLHDPRFYSVYTSNILAELNAKLTELKDYDFSLFNIQALIEEMNGKIVAGIEASIMSLFEKLTRKFAYDETIHNGNVWYFNGWRTNQAHKINAKVILPMNGLCAWSSRKQLDYRIHEELSDMVKVFNYLSDDKTDARLLVGNACARADRRENFSNIDLRYFTVTFYKKGTAHIRFTNQRLLDKFNIFGAQRKNWLPPAYGKKRYEDMDTEARAVVDSFQGPEAYAEVVRHASFYLVEPTSFLQLCAAPEAAQIAPGETEQQPAEQPAPAPLPPVAAQRADEPQAAPRPPQPQPMRPAEQEDTAPQRQLFAA